MYKAIVWFTIGYLWHKHGEWIAKEAILKTYTKVKEDLSD